MTLIATMIKMKPGCNNSNNLLEIDEVFIYNSGWLSKEFLYDYLKNPNHYNISVGFNGPLLEPALSSNGEKYVRSKANNKLYDNLLNLPRI